MIGSWGSGLASPPLVLPLVCGYCSGVVPTADACVVRLMFGVRVGEPPISRGAAHIAMPSPHRGGRWQPKADG